MYYTILADFIGRKRNSTAQLILALVFVRNRMLVNLRGRGGELGNLKP
jgi:hypothetical protein